MESMTELSHRPIAARAMLNGRYISPRDPSFGIGNSSILRNSSTMPPGMFLPNINGRRPRGAYVYLPFAHSPQNLFWTGLTIKTKQSPP